MRLDYKKSDIYKRLNFLTHSPTLSGEEEVVARAGQDIEDPWAKEDQSPGILGIHPLDGKGNVTAQYKKLLKDLHMVDLKPTQPVKPSKRIEKLNLKMRKLQEMKKNEARLLSEHITQQLILAENRKQEHLDMLRAEASFRKTLDKKIREAK